MRTFLCFLLVSSTLLAEDQYLPTGRYSPEATAAAKAEKAAAADKAKLSAQLDEISDKLEMLEMRIKPQPLKEEAPVVPPCLPQEVVPSKAPSPQKTTIVKGHSHKCSRCGTVWAHADHSSSASHTCPNCGATQFVQHDTNVPIAVKSVVSSSIVSAPIRYKSSGCSGGNCPFSGRIFRRR